MAPTSIIFVSRLPDRLLLRVRGFLLLLDLNLVNDIHLGRIRRALVVFMRNIAFIDHLTGYKLLGGALGVQFLHIDARGLAHWLAEGSATIILSCADVEHECLIGGLHRPAVRIMSVFALFFASIHHAWGLTIKGHRIYAVILRLFKLNFFDRLLYFLVDLLARFLILYFFFLKHC